MEDHWTSGLTTTKPKKEKGKRGKEEPSGTGRKIQGNGSSYGAWGRTSDFKSSPTWAATDKKDETVKDDDNVIYPRSDSSDFGNRNPWSFGGEASRNAAKKKTVSRGFNFSDLVVVDEIQELNMKREQSDVKAAAIAQGFTTSYTKDEKKGKKNKKKKRKKAAKDEPALAILAGVESEAKEDDIWGFWTTKSLIKNKEKVKKVLPDPIPEGKEEGDASTSSGHTSQGKKKGRRKSDHQEEIVQLHYPEELQAPDLSPTGSISKLAGPRSQVRSRSSSTGQGLLPTRLGKPTDPAQLPVGYPPHGSYRDSSITSAEIFINHRHSPSIVPSNTTESLHSVSTTPKQTASQGPSIFAQSQYSQDPAPPYMLPTIHHRSSRSQNSPYKNTSYVASSHTPGIQTKGARLTEAVISGNFAAEDTSDGPEVYTIFAALEGISIVKGKSPTILLSSVNAVGTVCLKVSRILFQRSDDLQSLTETSTEEIETTATELRTFHLVLDGLQERLEALYNFMSPVAQDDIETLLLFCQKVLRKIQDVISMPHNPSPTRKILKKESLNSSLKQAKQVRYHLTALKTACATFLSTISLAYTRTLLAAENSNLEDNQASPLSQPMDQIDAPVARLTSHLEDDVLAHFRAVWRWQQDERREYEKLQMPGLQRGSHSTHTSTSEASRWTSNLMCFESPYSDSDANESQEGLSITEVIQELLTKWTRKSRPKLAEAEQNLGLTSAGGIGSDRGKHVNQYWVTTASKAAEAERVGEKTLKGPAAPKSASGVDISRPILDQEPKRVTFESIEDEHFSSQRERELMESSAEEKEDRLNGVRNNDQIEAVEVLDEGKHNVVAPTVAEFKGDRSKRGAEDGATDGENDTLYGQPATKTGRVTDTLPKAGWEEWERIHLNGELRRPYPTDNSLRTNASHTNVQTFTMPGLPPMYYQPPQMLYNYTQMPFHAPPTGYWPWTAVTPAPTKPIGPQPEETMEKKPEAKPWRDETSTQSVAQYSPPAEGMPMETIHCARKENVIEVSADQIVKATDLLSAVQAARITTLKETIADLQLAVSSLQRTHSLREATAALLQGEVSTRTISSYRIFAGGQVRYRATQTESIEPISSDASIAEPEESVSSDSYDGGVDGITREGPIWAQVRDMIMFIFIFVIGVFLSVGLAITLHSDNGAAVQQVLSVMNS